MTESALFFFKLTLQGIKMKHTDKSISDCHYNNEDMDDTIIFFQYLILIHFFIISNNQNKANKIINYRCLN